MSTVSSNISPKAKRSSGLFSLLHPYRGLIALLIALAALSNGLGLVLPKLIETGIDAFMQGQFSLMGFSGPYLALAVGIFVLSYLQSLVQTAASERVARDLRETLAERISERSYLEVQGLGPSKLLTHLTSDIDAIKFFVSQAIPSMVSSGLLIVGASALLLSIHWRLGLAVLATLPVIAWIFFSVLRKVRPLFQKSQEAIDGLNRVISESILGAALIRVLNAQARERSSFAEVNARARDNGLVILRQFSGLIPFVTFVANLGSLIILLLGGYYVIDKTLSLGEFTAFNSYLAMLIFPIIMIGFMSNLIARASASHRRIEALLASKAPAEGALSVNLRGELGCESVSVKLGNKPVLKNVSFSLPAGSRTAVLGPTAAGKSTLLYLLSGLLLPDTGTIRIDGVDIAEYDKKSLHSQLGIVFQDSALFNLTVRENIAFNQQVSEADFNRALETAELTSFVAGLPMGLETIVSERGLSLSGGQKQRIMLARALALNPRVLLLDDFTARVDAVTEQKILTNLARNYPELTLLSVTQKISSVTAFDNILLLMEGELLASGSHAELMASSPEYVQIHQSQQSTQVYELRTE